MLLISYMNDERCVGKPGARYNRLAIAIPVKGAMPGRVVFDGSMV